MACIKGEIEFYENFELENFSTLKLKSRAKILYAPKNQSEFLYLLKTVENPIVIGNGSNTIFSSSGVFEPVILTKNLNEISVTPDFVEVEAGVKMPLLSKTVAENNLEGFEFLIGIPASLGGAVYMNAGAMETEIADIFLSAKIFDLKTKTVKEITKDNACFSYRHSAFAENDHIILSAKFKSKTGEKSQIKEKMFQNLALRKKKQPDLSEGNLGSVFKNPKNQSAGALIDKCGLKGFTFGGAKISEKHCNFIINTLNATSLDYVKVMHEAMLSVKNKFNIKLTPEVRYVGLKTDIEEKLWKELTEK